MAQPLLTIVPLLLSSASASPPVAPERVTGNVSTQHHQRRVTHPVTDACRVTGNIVPSKAMRAPCQLRLAEHNVITATPWLDEQCTATGRWEAHEATPVCVLPSLDAVDGPVLRVPAEQAEAVLPVEGV